MKLSAILIIFSWFIFSVSAQIAPESPTSRKTKLFSVKADQNNLTASGVSAGAFMANQLHIAYSKRFSGVGIIAGGQYYCAEGEVDKATKHCMKGTSFVNHQTAIQHAKSEFQNNRIDSLKNLRNDKVFLFSGKNDIVVSIQTMKELEKFYKYFLSSANIKTEFSHIAGHGFPTLHYGNDCTSQSYFNTPWILNCNYDAAGIILSFLYEGLHAPAEPKSENLIAFDQNEFITNNSSMGTTGHVYIPSACRTNKCKIHIALHGCDQDPMSVGDKFVNYAGYNRYAEANNIIILYPAAQKNYWGDPQNPIGCFDWWGYTGPNYHVKDSVQMKAIMGMVDRLAE